MYARSLLELTSHSYTTGLQTIALFGLKLHRFPAMLGMLTFLTVSVFPYRWRIMLCHLHYF